MEHNICECGGLLRGTLVVPSTVRNVRDANLLGIWQAALEEIRLADRLIILGYSMPAEDITVRSLLMRALNGRPRASSDSREEKPLRVEVVQLERPDAVVPAFPRFRMVFREDQLLADEYHVCGVEAWAKTRIRAPVDRQLSAAMKRIKARGR